MCLFENFRVVHRLRILGMTGIDQEFATLKPHNTVYKLVGPILVPQEQSEAKLNVDTRLDFIRGEMCAIVVLCGLIRE